MIRINKGPVPPILGANAGEWTTEFAAHRRDDNVPAAAATRYRHPQIKSAIRDESNDKCLYCESKVSHIYPGDVEHLLPKAHRPDLVVEWDNLGFVCAKCNNSKADYYSPEAPLVNPYKEEPADHLRFYGPSVFHESPRGYITRKKLALCRMELFEKRKEKLERLQTLIDLWAMQAAGPIKDQLQRDLLKETEQDSEYAAVARDFLRAKLAWEL